MESQSLTQKAEQAVVAMMESHDVHRSRTRRFSLLFVGSALLHVVAVIALLRSWGTTPVKPVRPVEPERPTVVEDVQVVRLELSVSTKSASEAIKLATTEMDLAAEGTQQLTSPEKKSVK